MKDFYLTTVEKLKDRGTMRVDDRVLVTCGGHVDRDTLLAAALKNVTISNVDHRLKGSEFAPYEWSFQDAEHLNFPDGSFDFVIAHSGLHHCRSPHRALLEMYRVCRKGLLVFEPRDSALLRLGVRLGFGQNYEVAAVIANGGSAGGVENSQIPNYVYRWTKRDFEKAISSFAPETSHRFEYFHALRTPTVSLSLQKKRLRLQLARVLQLIAPTAARLHFLANNIGFFVLKPTMPGDLHAWLCSENGEVRFAPAGKNSIRAETIFATLVRCANHSETTPS